MDKEWQGDIVSRLRAKGELTILETPEGVTVGIKSGEHVITLSNQNKDKLMAELLEITANWPDQN